jgi:hypothetical protein
MGNKFKLVFLPFRGNELDVIAKVMILGTIIDMDEQQLPIEWSTTVALPAYVLSPKGRLKDMSDDLLVALTTASNQKDKRSWQPAKDMQSQLKVCQRIRYSSRS